MEYKIIRSGGTGEIVEKKSRFIGVTFPISSEEEALSYIEKVKKEHYQARHNCFAFSVRRENGSAYERFSDDGEPQGTAGLPILNVIRGAEVNNICIVVTRYFGGTLLGTGGLVRAYTDAAKEAMSASEIHTVTRKMAVRLVMDYPDSGKVNFHISTAGYETEPAIFTDKVEQLIYVPYEEAEAFRKKVIEITSARAEVTFDSDTYR